MSSSPSMPAQALSFEALKAKQRAIRADFPSDFGLRIHRAISWLGRAEREVDRDPDVGFILLWVGFNAAYAAEVPRELGERSAFKAYFDALVSLDRGHRIYNAVWARFSQEIRILLANRYVFAPFWSHANGDPSSADWETRLAASQARTHRAMQDRDTAMLLSIVFDRLYVLRNQLVHGGATWNGGVNRGQVRDGAAVLGWLLPLFIDVMMDEPSRSWGRPFYPVQEDA